MKTSEKIWSPSATARVNAARDGRVLRFFVGGVGTDATEAQVRGAFLGVGVALVDVELVVNHATGLNRGFAYVSVDWPSSGIPDTWPATLLERMDGVTVNQRTSSVRPIHLAD